MNIGWIAKKLLVSFLCLLLAFLLLLASTPVSSGPGGAAAAESGLEEPVRTKGQNIKGEPDRLSFQLDE